MKPFKEEFTLEERAKESAAMIASYPARIPKMLFKSLHVSLELWNNSRVSCQGKCPINGFGQYFQALNKRIKVIVERFSSSSLPEMEKRKYLVPCDMPVGQFIFILRSRLNLSPGTALFVFVNNTLPQTAQLMGSVYESYKDEGDGFLYMCYSSEKTFG